MKNVKSQFELEYENLKLNIRTYADQRGRIVTIAECVKIDGQFESHAVFYDFNKALIVSAPKRRTQGLIDAQQRTAVEKVEEIKQTAISHYQKEAVTA